MLVGGTAHSYSEEGYRSSWGQPWINIQKEDEEVRSWYPGIKVILKTIQVNIYESISAAQIITVQSCLQLFWLALLIWKPFLEVTICKHVPISMKTPCLQSLEIFITFFFQRANHLG